MKAQQQMSSVRAPASLKVGNQVQTYRSDQLQVSSQGIQGYIRKAIENKSLFHQTDYHKKYLKLDFASEYCHFFEELGSAIPSRSHLQSDIKSCEVLADEEIEQKVTEREQKRSASLLRRFVSNSAQRCKWNFGFILEFRVNESSRLKSKANDSFASPRKEYELYAPTRKDREQWVKIFSTIAEMNR